MEAQDEGELFDLYTREGVPLGIRKPRAAVHRDGDWHRSVHIWVWGLIDGAPHLVFQRRAAGKDTWPLALDVAVTGHARAGESIEETLREADEEIGLPVLPADLLRLGLRRRADRRAFPRWGRERPQTPGSCGALPDALDNELQEIFARVAPVEITALTPCPAELQGLVALPFGEAGPVLREGKEAAGWRLLREGGDARLVPAPIRGTELVPAPDGYYEKAYASLAVMLAGGAPNEWTIG